MKFEANYLTQVNGGIKKGEGSTFVFETDKSKNGCPIKLGDGSFGVVYKVKQEGSEDAYAVKIFYYREGLNTIQQDKEFIKERFFNELNYYKIIKKVFESTPELKNFSPSGIIKPFMATTSFRESQAYHKIFGENGIEKDKVRVSDYAIVLPLYSGTLKDILENTKIPENLKSDKTGYDMLKESPANKRILAMIPLLKTLVTGMKSLYIGGFNHLDIKPANIFYRLNNLNEIEFTLADMGYLDTRTAYLHTIIMNDDQALLGTLGYRSPEQVNYFDKCNAKVEIKNNEVILTVNDPKFKNTLIRKGDLLFFSKAEVRKAYSIKSIVPTEVNKNEIIITIEQTEEDFQNKLIVPEDKTQVEFRKVQGIKTDLFGLGAIALDLLTAGESPEAFYEMMKNRDSDRETVTNILTDYQNVNRLLNEKAEAAHIFKMMRIANNFADEKIVEFILKCMLYNTSGTFYDQIPSDNPYSVFDLIMKDLDDIRDRVVSRFQGEHIPYDRIPYQLFIEKMPGEKMTEKRPELYYKLEELSSTSPNLFYWRLARGVKYLDMIIAFVRKAIYDKGGQYFIECYPQNLWFYQNGSDISIKSYITFAPNEETYKKHIENDKVVNNLNVDYFNYFVPDEIAFIRREVQLKPSGQDSDQQVYFYNLLSKSPASISFQPGDWIVQKNKSAIRILAVNPTEKTMTLSEKVETESTDEKRPVTVVYYHNIDRLKYYLNIIGSYIQHLIFAEQGPLNTKEVPRKKQLVWNGLFPDYTVRIPRYETKSTVSRIYARLGQLYARLVLTDFRESFYFRFQNGSTAKSPNEHARDIMVSVANELNDIIEDIEVSLFGQKGFITQRKVSEFDSPEVFENHKITTSPAELPVFESIIERLIVKEDVVSFFGKKFMTGTPKREFHSVETPV